MADTDMPVSDILDAVLNFLRDEDWKFETTDIVTPTLRMRFEGENAIWSCYARIFPSERELVFYSVFPIEIPPMQRTLMMEGVTRANSGITQGNFEMDLSDGEILFKTSITVKDDKLTPQLVRNLVYANVGAMDQYFPALNQVLYGIASPEMAFSN